jgi:hypothetical protein
VSRYRVTRTENPSERFEDDFDDVFVSKGQWVFARKGASGPVGAGPTFGDWSVHAYTVEIEEHGGTWRVIDSATLEPSD